jgi:DNA modification methylase
VIEPTWESKDSSVQLYLGDCLEVLPTLAAGSVDAVVTDPPYGNGYVSPSPLGNRCSRLHAGAAYGQASLVGNDQAFDPAPILALGRPTILWGANNYASRLPDRASWIIWDKRVDPRFYGCNSFADCELAWCSDGRAARLHRQIWNGLVRAGEPRADRVHPTQKPIKLMVFCIERISQEGQTILDPFMGSGTTGVACVATGRKFIGIEIDAGYFEIARKRIEVAGMQVRMAL